VPLRVAAIDFLNPAPLMWDFHHPPHATALAERYALHLTAPSQCAAELLAGRADLGLIPIAALAPELRIVPGCTIASLARVRSIQLISRVPLEQVRTVAADTASRSSVAYAQVLFRHFLGTDPRFQPAAADPEAMLTRADAALLIGDPALLALERRPAIEAAVGPCIWHDLAAEWNSRTGLPWVAAVWAVRPETVPTPGSRERLIADLNASRDHGLAHVEDLVAEWTPRIALPPPTIRTYLTENIHYDLDAPCIRAIKTFRHLAALTGILPPLPVLPFLEA
jgi:chorismate dehydratase